ncbi:MAG TPA: serine/threonine-protein kinase [Thermoanaerobaculia bacterium]
MPVAGTLIEGKYEILAKIKEGGMGTIYKVRHRLLDEVRVVKVMRPQIGADEELKRRFTQEAKTATRLKHPNIGAILDFALDSDGMAYIVMEFIDGVNLTELLKASGPPGVPMTLEIAHQTLLALGFLHRKNVVHRDVAPDNLMLTHDDEGRPQVKLIDLGIAKPLDKTINLTSTGIFLGKLKYSSPEQLGGLGEGETLDGRSDLYSLGVALYELLTGQLPFPGESPRELFAAHLFKDAVPFSVTDPANRVPEPVRAVVSKAIEKERGRRFANAEEFDREILSIRHALGFSSDPEATQRILAKVRESRGTPHDTVTPSAQDRLDRYFLAQGTPTPRPPPTAPGILPTAVAGEWEETVAAPMTEETGRRRSPLPIAAIVLAGAAAVIAALLAVQRRPASSRGGEVSRPSEPPPTAAVAQILPPTAAPEAPTAPPPTEAAPREETAAPSTSERDTGRLRRVAEDARGSAKSARGAAERARAPEVAGALYESARKKEKEGQRLLGDGRYEAAAASFDYAAALFRQAESWSRTAPQRPAERVASLPPPVREPTSLPASARPAPIAAPTAAVEEPKPAPTKVAEPPAKTRSEEDRVRDAVALYVQAQNGLDVALYARVYPGLSGERRRMVEAAFGSLKSQTLELNIRKVTVDGSHATVSGYERRLAVPRVGAEQRDARERVLYLEKRGEGWVITSLN